MQSRQNNKEKQIFQQKNEKSQINGNASGTSNDPDSMGYSFYNYLLLQYYHPVKTDHSDFSCFCELFYNNKPLIYVIDGKQTFLFITIVTVL